MNNQNQQQINDEHEEWMTIVDPETMTPRRVKQANYSLNEVAPGASAPTPVQKPLTEA